MEGALEFQNQARFQPLHFLYHLAEQLPVYEKTRVLRVEGNIVETDQGMVEAKNIVFATHYPFVNVPGYFFATEKDNRICNEGIGSPQPRDDSWDGKTADSCSKKKGQ